MSGKKKKVKKVSAKKEKYAKFHREKPGALDINFPDLDDEQQKQKKIDEEKVEKFLRFNRNKPAPEIVERRMSDKRSRTRG
ncbi:hypothetical protein K9L97_02780 [Candidatus Woesearchaeota archaeon]|nr:hypothetical protein [Candidatus Woesearchaeota archaeon]